MTTLTSIATPQLWRRLACLVYELMILFGISLIPGAIGALFFKLTGQQHLLQSEVSLRVFSFVIYGIYFTWCWSKRGQTLPMQTWHICVVTTSGQPLSQKRALWRYVLSWLWIAPAVLIAYLAGWSGGAFFGAVLLGAAIYAGLTYLRSDRQFWHDIWAGTRLITTVGAKKNHMSFLRDVEAG